MEGGFWGGGWGGGAEGFDGEGEGGWNGIYALWAWGCCRLACFVGILSGFGASLAMEKPLISSWSKPSYTRSTNTTWYHALESPATDLNEQRSTSCRFCESSGGHRYAYVVERTYRPTTIQWSTKTKLSAPHSPPRDDVGYSPLSKGSSVNCSIGLILSSFIFCTSLANTASGAAVLSIQFAFTETTIPPPTFRYKCAFSPTIRAWSGCATSAKMTSTMETSMR